MASAGGCYVRGLLEDKRKDTQLNLNGWICSYCQFVLFIPLTQIGITILELNVVTVKIE